MQHGYRQSNTGFKPEFYKRRIIFWYDEDREFEDKLEDIEISGRKR